MMCHAQVLNRKTDLLEAASHGRLVQAIQVQAEVGWLLPEGCLAQHLSKQTLILQDCHWMVRHVQALKSKTDLLKVASHGRLVQAGQV